MNPQIALAVILLSLVVHRPTITFGADLTAPNTSQKPNSLPSSLHRVFMSHFAAEIVGDLGRAAIKSIELEISTINETLDYLNKFKPPLGTTASLIQNIQLAINDLSSTSEDHETSVDDMKSLVPKPANRQILRVKCLRSIRLWSYIDYVKDCIESFDSPESPAKLDIIARLNGVIARATVAKCMIYPYSQQ